MIRIEVKHDTRHNKWHRLSVGLYDAMAGHEYRSKLANTCEEYMLNYSQMHQMNHHQIAVRAISHDDKVIYERVSNATANRPQS